MPEVKLFRIGRSIVIGEEIESSCGITTIDNAMELFKLRSVWRIMPLTSRGIPFTAPVIQTLSASSELKKVYSRFVVLQQLLSSFSVSDLVSLFGYDIFKGDIIPSLALVKLRSGITFEKVLKELESFKGLPTLAKSRLTGVCEVV